MKSLCNIAIVACAYGAAIDVRGSNGLIHKRPLKQFTNLVTFGDSYTDEDRLSYLVAHNDTGPPPGTLLPESFSTASGGITWDRWVSIYSGAKLYDYAVSGAVCSSTQIPRYLASINAPFPGVIEYEVPAFIADTQYINSSTGTITLYTDRNADNTVYAMWIGTNDLGVKAILTDSQERGTNITTFTHCVFEAFDSIYAAGGRYFVLINTAPLQLSPLYGTAAAGGVTTSHYWPNKPSNITAISFKMLEYTITVNQIWDFQVPYELHIANRYPGAEIAIFDVHSLMSEIYYNPSAYLNGSAPANATGFYHHCDDNSENCYNYEAGSLDSFMWYDELHKSNRTDQVIANEFIRVVEGNSKYATYW